MPVLDADGDPLAAITHVVYDVNTTVLDTYKDGRLKTQEIGAYTFATSPGEDNASTADVDESLTPIYYRVNARLSSPATAKTAKTDADGSAGARQSNISLSGGFGSLTIGRLWSASYNHYGAALDPTWFNGASGGATYIIGNAISYSSSAGDVSFQIDKVTGDNEMIQFGATAALGPIGVGLGYWDNTNDDKSFTGVALSTGAGGVGLAVGLGSVDNKTGMDTDTSLLSLSGAVGDTGVSYGVQVTNSDDDAADQNLVSLVNILGPGAAIHFEHLDPGEGESSSHLVLKVDF